MIAQAPEPAVPPGSPSTGLHVDQNNGNDHRWITLLAYLNSLPDGDGGGKRTEANVGLYNAAALETLAPDIKSGRIAVHDLHGDIGEVIGGAAGGCVTVWAEAGRRLVGGLGAALCPSPRIGRRNGVNTFLGICTSKVSLHGAVTAKCFAHTISWLHLAPGPSTRAAVARCGATYTATGACELQIPNNVHFEYEGRQFCGLSVARSLLKALYGFTATSTL